MKVLLLANLDSVHTIKWVNSLAKKGLEIFVIGLSNYNKRDYNDNNITIYTCGIKESSVYNNEGSFFKLKYIKVIPKIRKIIKEVNPDIVHAHYASSYGLLGALCNFHPFIISVWGSDIYSFPKRSIFHKILIKFCFKRADRILSTSHAMAEEIKKYTPKEIKVTPFGIDLNLFKPGKPETLFNKDSTVIGTIKTLDPIYGIEYLIHSFSIIKRKHYNQQLKLLIVGSGPIENTLKKLVKDLHIENDTVFTGKIPYSKIQEYHNMLSVFVCLSNRESFGVSVIEASACEKPVVVSDVGGLPELVDDGLTGYIVPSQDPVKAAEALEKLVLDKELRIKMGKAGRKKVKSMYNWDDNVEKMIRIYNELINR